MALPKIRTQFDYLVNEAGLAKARYTLHSLRRGGASLAKQFGATLDDVKRHGTWRSDAVWGYLHNQPTYDSVAKAFKRAARVYFP